MTPHDEPFLGLAPCEFETADAVILPLPFERTVSYGLGTGKAPQAILEASLQIEYFDHETRVDFATSPALRTEAPVLDNGNVEDYLQAVQERVHRLRPKLVVSIGGEHTATYAAAMGLAETPKNLTVVQIDAHADLIDELDGLRWSHGTVMRRLWEAGCRVVQIGVRSLSREECDLAERDQRITTFYAHELADRWAELMVALRDLTGDVYLTFDADGFDPSVMPSTGTPQPEGLRWRQAMEILQSLTCASSCRLLGADVMEFVPSPNPPGCDITAAKLVYKILAYWAARGSRCR